MTEYYIDFAGVRFGPFYNAEQLQAAGFRVPDMPKRSAVIRADILTLEKESNGSDRR